MVAQGRHTRLDKMPRPDKRHAHNTRDSCQARDRSWRHWKQQKSGRRGVMSTYETTQSPLSVSIQPSVDAVTGIDQGMAAVGGRPRLLSGWTGWNGLSRVVDPCPSLRRVMQGTHSVLALEALALTLAHSAWPDHWAVSAVSLLTTPITSSRGRRSCM